MKSWDLSLSLSLQSFFFFIFSFFFIFFFSFSLSDDQLNLRKLWTYGLFPPLAEDSRKDKQRTTHHSLTAESQLWRGGCCSSGFVAGDSPVHRSEGGPRQCRSGPSGTTLQHKVHTPFPFLRPLLHMINLPAPLTKTKLKTEWEAQAGKCQRSKSIFKKGSCGGTALDMPEWREMTTQIVWQAKQPLQVACISQDFMCWGAWDTMCGHKAKDSTPLTAWRREVWKEEALDDLPWKDKRGPSWITNFWIISKAMSGNFWETPPAGTKPRTSHLWLPGGERCGKRN